MCLPSQSPWAAPRSGWTAHGDEEQDGRQPDAAAVAGVEAESDRDGSVLEEDVEVDTKQYERPEKQGKEKVEELSETGDPVSGTERNYQPNNQIYECAKRNTAPFDDIHNCSSR
jgi:hypothetical protein